MKKISNSKEIDVFVRQLIQQGWLLHYGRKHKAVISPNGKKITIPSTPSDYRSWYNFKSLINRNLIL